MPKVDYEYGQQKAQNQVFIDRIKEVEKEEAKQNSLLDRLQSIGISAGISGGILGTGGAALGGVKNLPGLAKGGILGAAGSAGLATLANLVGSAVEPEADDLTANTRRGLYGGLLGGGLAGGALGALAATGKLGGAGRLGQKIAPDVTKNIFADWIKKTGASSLSPTTKALVGGGIGASVGGGAGSFVGADEGMQYDVIMEEARRRGLV